MNNRTYIDSSVLLAACARKDEIGRRALEILDDPGRSFVLSDAVRLEIFPKAIYRPPRLFSKTSSNPLFLFILIDYWTINQATEFFYVNLYGIFLQNISFPVKICPNFSHGSLPIRGCLIYEKRQDEIDFYDAVFLQGEELKWRTDTLYHAHDIAAKHGIAAMDAIHVATALDAGVDEFVTAEKSTKPMFRVAELHMHSIR